jgi:hypothetical protein
LGQGKQINWRLRRAADGLHCLRIFILFFSMAGSTVQMITLRSECNISYTLQGLTFS